MKPITKHISTFFRSASIQDLDQILRIEQRAYSQPWSEQKFVDSFNHADIDIQLATQDQMVIGYCLTLPSLEFVDVLNICIDPDYQQQGLGRQLLDNLCKQHKGSARKAIMLEVRESNIVAINFYQSYGFKQIDIRKKYYSNGEDAKILRLQID
ncbi:MAG: ribosomal protein S18-alanine N-acetyltransferase [Candidatus Thioglobus sp.]|uniref:ribosomal protein S18-alanine N-acetyltransferase n=1 Tax=Candidatus Thioglobus sp. TaxID=2026721 RepID=UPI002601CFDE|nr:ribosomal protein S18-alanine N-acetyltransferase [Candidatus Thioglobus sp.]MDC9727047.1 ribosomal protein S18-alanine N-acetyltransferase [Candidatus Thioglobus sp.]